MLVDMISSIDKKYSHPKCIYIDLNSEVDRPWAIDILEEWRVDGWTIHKNDNWTRKGYTGQ